ncbi:hypothetical protein HYH02_014575 [Chlamydomonas schloesseri]|uniref:Uncharacterized protein n=1 Tax=Chlamydomonas schloesseri TaxID=2026947 RepID=A0A835VVZ6_9CHLO|nr:hypothetical protein HYH02_014575 [Chlamydomonas schloesseri]|eukprot:KAG2427529.1 hypothetical protein HYH02_014575 [Chlamydomonas schloesseri]
MADRGRGRGRGGAGRGGRGGRGPGDIEDELDDNAAAAAAGGAGDEEPLDEPDDSPATRALHRVVGDLLKPANAQLSHVAKLMLEVKKLAESHKADIGQVLALIPAPSSADPPPAAGTGTGVIAAAGAAGAAGAGAGGAASNLPSEEKQRDFQKASRRLEALVEAHTRPTDPKGLHIEVYIVAQRPRWLSSTIGLAALPKIYEPVDGKAFDVERFVKDEASTKREEWEAQALKDRERSRFGGSSDKDDRYHKSSSASKGSDSKKDYYKKP